MKRVALIGAGITGLTTAFKLRKGGLSVSLFDSAERVGGVIRTEKQSGFTADAGPNSLRLAQPEVEALFSELNLGDELVVANPEMKKRFIVKNGKLIAITPSPLALITNPLISTKAKLRVLKEPFVRRGLPNGDESVGDFIERRLGREILDYAVNPLVSGIFAGNPKILSMRHAFPKIWRLEKEYGSLFFGGIRKGRESKKNRGNFKSRIISFRSGLEALPRAFQTCLGESIITNAAITSLRRDRGWELAWREGESEHSASFDALVLTLPAHAVSNLPFPENFRITLQFFDQIDYSPVSVVVTGFKREDVAHPLDGYGLLVPETENLQTLGTIFSSSLFPNRSPDGHVLLTTFVGGARQPELAALSSQGLFRVVSEDLEKLIGIKADPVFFQPCFWPRAIPQYNLGYGEILGRIAQLEKEQPGLYFTGSFRRGIAIGQCLVAGLEMAEKVLTDLS